MRSRLLTRVCTAVADLMQQYATYRRVTSRLARAELDDACGDPPSDRARFRGAQLYPVHLFFEEMEAGIADFAALTRGPQRAPGGIHRAQSQAVGRWARTRHGSLAVGINEGVLEFDAKCLASRDGSPASDARARM